MTSPKPVKSFKVAQLNVEVYETDITLGRRAADFVAAKLTTAIEQNGKANLILATGASQFKFLDAFKASNRVDWSQITVFHLDEYKDISGRHPASFRRYLRERILDEVKPAEVHFLEGDAGDVDTVLKRYENLLRSHPVDVACIGIGENGHIAFNDPPAADFNDPRLVKVVELDEKCRRQQMGEGWFETLAEVPTHALSLTIPAIMNCKTISCVVPDSRKAEAVFNTLHGPVTTHCPASILRKHSGAVLFLDLYSAEKLTDFV
ncbi:MAG TPA: glucosamine-6-phosphate deaminase [Bacteroidetes bacterium]|nr:glucosamine-6-phosphate deaminase [Bacteroidota bacterium]